MATYVTPDYQTIDVPEPPAPQLMLDTDNVPQVVDPDSVQNALAKGWTITDEAGADHANALIEAAQHPIEAAGVAFANAIPGSSLALKAAEGLTGAIYGGQVNPEDVRQGFSNLAEANPIASNLGTFGGIAAATSEAGFGALGKATAGAVAAGLENTALPAIPMLAKMAGTATTFGTYGAANEINEESLGNKDFNAEAILSSGLKGAVLGAATEPLFGAAAAIMPKVVSKGADLTTKLTDATSDALSWVYGKTANVEGVAPEVNQAAAKDIYNTVAAGGKAVDVPIQAATKYATTLNDAVNQGYDTIKAMNETLLPKQSKNLLGAQPESQIISGGNNFVQKVINPFRTQMEEATARGEFAPAMGRVVRKAINDFSEISENPETTVPEAHQAFVNMRKTIDPVLKYGHNFATGSLDGTTASMIEQGLQTPLRQFLKNPEVWGEPLAAAHTAAMDAEHDFFTAANAVSKTVEGPELLPETPRPDREVKPAKILTMLRGEGTSIPQIERAEVIKNFSDKFAALQKAAENAATNAGETIDKDTVPNLLKAIHEQHEGGLAAAKLGTRGKGWIQGGTNLELPIELAALTGHMGLGGAGVAVQQVLRAVNNPTKAMNILGTIAKLANKHQAAIGRGAATFLNGLAKPSAAVGLSILNDKSFAGGKSSKTAMTDFEKRTNEIKTLMSNPSQLQNTLTNNTSALVPVAPGHASAIQQVSLTKLATIAAAIPQDPNQSFLPGPKYVPTADEVAHFERVYAVVTNPVETTFNALNTGMFTPDMMIALKASNPATLKAIQDSLQAEIVNNPNREYNFATKSMLSMILEQPVTPELSSAQTQFQQATFAPAPIAPPTGAQPNSRTRVSGLNKLNVAESTATPGQARSIERNS